LTTEVPHVVRTRGPEEASMLIGVPLETADGETRVAVTPETAKKLAAMGHTVRLQAGAGVAASATDAAYSAVGTEITDAAGAFGCELVLKVRAPSVAELPHLKPGAAPVCNAWPPQASPASRWRPLRAPPARKAWTCCRRKPTSLATRR
jgi:hypothetical protein